MDTKKAVSKNNSTKRLDCNPNDAPLLENPIRTAEAATQRQKKYSKSKRNIVAKKNSLVNHEDYLLP